MVDQMTSMLSRHSEVAVTDLAKVVEADVAGIAPEPFYILVHLMMIALLHALLKEGGYPIPTPPWVPAFAGMTRCEAGITMGGAEVPS